MITFLKKNFICFGKDVLWKIIYINGFNQVPSNFIKKTENHYGIKMKTKKDVIIKVITTKNGLSGTEVYDNNVKGVIAEYGVVYKKGDLSVNHTDLTKHKFNEKNIDNLLEKFKGTYNRDFNGMLIKHPSDDLIKYDENDKLD